MKLIVKFVFAASLVLSLSGCGDPTIDSSSDEAMKKSVQNIMSELSEDDQKRFMKTIKGIYVIGALAHMGKNTSKEEIKASINEKLDGKTAEDIFVMASEMKKRMNERKK